MKDIPSKFVEALKNILSKDDKRSKRIVEKMENEPEKTAEHIYHELGSDTQKIKLK